LNSAPIWATQPEKHSATTVPANTGAATEPPLQTARLSVSIADRTRHRFSD